MATVVQPMGDVPNIFARSVLLAGASGEEWEREATSMLTGSGDLGGSDKTVVIVSDCDSESDSSAWRARAEAVSDAIVCWIPPGSQSSDFYLRLLETWGSSGKLFVGHPASSWAALLTAGSRLAAAPTLADLIDVVAKKCKDGAERRGAEREVPLMIWNTTPWQLWYKSVLDAGNRLDGAKVCWSFRVGPGGAFVLFWAVHANIYVNAERRNKSNEVVIARPDIACVLAYFPGESMLDTEIIAIKEFRSPCRNEYGFVYELPGGSSFKPNSDVFQTAADELFEETGIRVDKSRLRKEMSRQASATVTTHHVHLFSCQLSATEMAEARAHASKETAFGNECETERTYIETVTLREAIPSAKLDFTTLGMIMQTIGLFFDATSPGLSVMASAGRDEGNGSPVAALEHMTVSALSGGSSSPSSVADEEEMLERVSSDILRRNIQHAMDVETIAAHGREIERLTKLLSSAGGGQAAAGTGSSAE